VLDTVGYGHSTGMVLELVVIWNRFPSDIVLCMIVAGTVSAGILFIGRPWFLSYQYPDRRGRGAGNGIYSMRWSSVVS
jgi:hypothetical protein